ncbi:MAG: amidohydrolase family protein [Tepidisphaeraceae bacterium]
MSIEERRAKTLVTAAWVAPMDDEAAMLRDAGLVHAAGRIVAVGDAKSLRRAHPEAIIEDLGDVVLLPGLVNAHTHLELSDLAPYDFRPGSFVDWLLQVMRKAPESQHAVRIHRATEIGIAMSLRHGVTCVGDVSRYSETTRRLIKGASLRAVSYGEVTGMAGRREFAKPRLARAVQYAAVPGRLHLGVSPHAPYSIEAEGYRLCLAEATKRRIGLATHLAETPDEVAFLTDHSGPLRDLWENIGGWDERVPVFHGGPIRYANSLGLLDYPMTSLAHVNYCDDDELAILASGVASVVYCPRTHRYFGHPPHRWREMLGAGINVAVGTDSTASSPDLNLVDDLRLLREIAPDVPASMIWSMATRRAARAVGMEDEAGTLTAGKYADFVAFGAKTNDPLAAILDERSIVPAGVWIGGQRLT